MEMRKAPKKPHFCVRDSLPFIRLRRSRRMHVDRRTYYDVYATGLVKKKKKIQKPPDETESGD